MLYAWRHPDSSSQESSVQPLASSQLRGPPAVHAPALHVSFTVQASPSLQAVPVSGGYSHTPRPRVTRPVTDQVAPFTGAGVCDTDSSVAVPVPSFIPQRA